MPSATRDSGEGARTRHWKASISRDRTPCDHALIARFLVTIEGPGWTDVQDVELPRLPDVGESLETKFGTMLVAQVEEAPDLSSYAGKIVCRFA